MITSNYPENSVRVKFKPLSGRSHGYRIWENNNHWFWYALGNGGMENTQETAMFAAREWINKGTNGISRTRNSPAR